MANEKLRSWQKVMYYLLSHFRCDDRFEVDGVRVLFTVEIPKIDGRKKFT